MSEKIDEKYVRDMARLVLLSNRLSSFHEKNLKLFPLVFFNGIKTTKIEYDFSNNLDADIDANKNNLNVNYKINKPSTENLKTSYFLEIDPKVDNSNMDKRLEALENSVRNLLWKNVKVQIFINDKLEYESKQNV